MKSKIVQKQLQLHGKVVQILEISGEKIAKIFIEPASIDFVIGTNEEVNLGDIISFEAAVNEKSLKSPAGIVKDLLF